MGVSNFDARRMKPLDCSKRQVARAANLSGVKNMNSECYAMSLKTLADDAVMQISKAIPGRISEAETEVISRIVEHTLIKAVNQASENCTSAAVVCCGPEADLAHKIAEEVDRAQYALIANLVSMR